jgi:hypothetical protein
MNCWHCNTELIWGADHDIEDESDHFLILTNLSCPNCGSHVDVYLPKWDKEEDDGGKLTNGDVRSEE